MASTEDRLDLVDHEELPVPEADDIRVAIDDPVTSSASESDASPTPNGQVETADQNGNRKTAVSTEQAEVTFSSGGGYPVIYATPGSTRRVDATSNNADGTIATPSAEEEEPEERPLKAKHLKNFKIFGVIALILFPPTGIPALIFALQTEREFWAGCESGDLTIAKRKAKFAERLIIFSVILGILTYVLLLAVFEKHVIDSEHDYAMRRMGLLHG